LTLKFASPCLFRQLGFFRNVGQLGILCGMPSEFKDVDPRELRVPPSRPVADPIKLARQIARFGASAAGMPPLVVYEGAADANRFSHIPQTICGIFQFPHAVIAGTKSFRVAPAAYHDGISTPTGASRHRRFIVCLSSHVIAPTNPASDQTPRSPPIALLAHSLLFLNPPQQIFSELIIFGRFYDGKDT
jgi:hypothetical protein